MSDALANQDANRFEFAVTFDFDGFPTTTVHQSRIQLFEPTRRPTNCERVIKTSWGSALVKGKLGQGHADVLEAMCFRQEKWRLAAAGHIELLIDLYQMRKAANGGFPGSGTQLNVVLDDLMQAIVDIEIPARGIRIRGHIIDEIVESLVTKASRGFGKGRKPGEPRHLTKVTLGRAYVGLVGADLHRHYDPTPISALQFGVSQAIARHIATHSQMPPGGWHLDGLFETVGAGDSSKLGNRRREIKKDAEGLEALGIVVVNGRVTRQRLAQARSPHAPNATSRVSNA